MVLNKIHSTGQNFNLKSFKVSRLAKKIIVSESERVNLQNQLDLYKDNHDVLLSKYNDSSVEIQRRVTLEEHLNQIGVLRQYIFNKAKTMFKQRYREEQNVVACVTVLG